MSDDQADMQMPQPTPEHQRIAEQAGNWDVACTFYMDPSQPPMQVEACEVIESFGGFWTTSTFEAQMFGMPFKGKSTLGFDPAAGEYVSTWIDTMSSALFVLRGTYDAAGKVLEMRGRAPSMMTGEPADYRTTEEHVSKDERLFEMFTTLPDGTEMKMFTHRYTRA